MDTDGLRILARMIARAHADRQRDAMGQANPSPQADTGDGSGVSVSELVPDGVPGTHTVPKRSQGVPEGPARNTTTKEVHDG